MPRISFHGRQVARLVHDQPPLESGERRFHLPAVTLPLGPRLGRKTRPHPARSQRRGNSGGRKRGDVVRNRGVFKRPERCVGDRAPGRLLRCGPWAALALLRLRPGHRGTNLGPVLPAPLERPQRHSSTPAGPVARISAGPVAHTVFLAAARGVRTSAGEATPSAAPQPRSGQRLSSGGRPVCAKTGPRTPSSALRLNPLRPGLARPGSRDSPPGSTQAIPGSKGHLRASCRVGSPVRSRGGGGEPPRLSAEMVPPGPSPLLQSLSFSPRRQGQSPASGRALHSTLRTD